MTVTFGPTIGAAQRQLWTPEDWRLFQVFGRLLEAQQWIFAKTMAHNPHWYTLRRKWESNADFEWTVTFLRQFGYRSKFGRTWYTQIDVNDHFYWTMGSPINYPNGTACTILINRKPLVDLEGRVVPYDAIADRYDDLFVDPVSLAEDQKVFGLVGNLSEQHVLDIGCGTGLALAYAETAASYIGIDPSAKMLERLKERYPEADTVCTTLGAFVPSEITQFDVVLALYGTGSYLSDAELHRIPLLVAPGGQAIVMFYAEGYFPATYQKTNVIVPHRSWKDGMFPGAPMMLGNHVIVVYQG